MEKIDTGQMTSQEIDALCAKLRAEKLTYERIGEMIGVSKERVRQRLCRNERRRKANDPEHQKMLNWQRLNNYAPSRHELHYLLVLLPFLKELAQCK